MQHELYMRRCLELSQRGKGLTAPNPMVGAILVYNDKIIGEGWHHFYGADHAEINCLRNVKEEDKHLIPESTMYVNLEPCAHYGITPPCSTSLVQAHVKQVIVCNLDPFEKVRGKGIEILKAGGVTVVSGILTDNGFWVNRRFFCFHKQSRPYIILKWAKTQDGFIAPNSRQRFQITNNTSNKLVHKWRTEESAILVGTKTALFDNPQLTARHWSGKQPLRILLDKTLKIPSNHHLYNNEAATWIINEKKEGLQGNIHFINIVFNESLIANLLHKLFEHKIVSLIVEGGAELLNNFINNELWDEARVFTGSQLLQEGLVAPILSNSNFAFQSQLDGESIQIFVNKDSEYQYPTAINFEL